MLGLGFWDFGNMGLKRNGEGDRVLGVRFNMAGNGWVWVGLFLAGVIKYGLNSVHCVAHVYDHPRINDPDVFECCLNRCLESGHVCIWFHRIGW